MIVEISEERFQKGLFTIFSLIRNIGRDWEEIIMKNCACFAIVVSIFLMNVHTLSADMLPPPLSGSVSTDAGTLISTPSWYLGDGSTLEWNITDKGDYYTYSYKFTVPILTDVKSGDMTKDLSHIIFEVSDNFTEDNYLKSSVSDYEEIGYFSPSNGNPQMPGEIKLGIKFDVSDTSVSMSDTTKSYSVTFDSDRIPTWGDFYAKDGSENIFPMPTILSVDVAPKLFVTAWNSGFGSEYCFEGAKIVVPDTLPKVPVPGAVLLGMLGMGMAGIKLRKV